MLVIHEAFGDQPEIREVCEEFARRGYVAAMPDLFSVGGPRVLCVAKTMVESARGDNGRISGYLEATRAWLAARDDVDAERIGVIGFCMGGAFALAYVAGGRPGVRAASVNYGDVPKDAERLRGICPVVGSYGGRDMVMRGAGARLRSHLEQLGVEHDVKIYEDAGHSFMTEGDHKLGKLIFLPMRIGHVPHAAADAWQRVFDFFDARLEPGRVAPVEE